MAGVNDLLTSWNGSEDGIPDNYAELIGAAYDEDFSIPAAKIAELEGQIATLTAANATLKAQNYDLLMQLPKVDDAGPGDDDGDGDGEDGDGPDYDENITTDQLFG